MHSLRAGVRSASNSLFAIAPLVLILGQATALENLQFGTAWLFLGYVHADSGEWASAQDFEVLRPAESSERSTLPKVGEPIKLTFEQRLFILDFETRGEARRLDPPANTRLTPKDSAGVLPTGAILKICAIVKEPETQGIQGIWARVGKC